MTELTQPQRASITQALTAERATLLESVSYLDRNAAEISESQISGEARPRGEGEGDSLAVERHLVNQLSSAARASLAEIDDALARLANGTYGTCRGCRGQIPAARLEVRPRTTLCVPCASR